MYHTLLRWLFSEPPLWLRLQVVYTIRQVRSLVQTVLPKMTTRSRERGHRKTRVLVRAHACVVGLTKS